MRNPFKRKTPKEKLLEALKTNPVCRPMNDLRESDTPDKDGNLRMWLNPHEQQLFNYGWFTYQDFYDWIDGKGPIVKGKTPEEKQKFMEVAKFLLEHDYAWSFAYHKQHFQYIDDTYQPKMSTTFMEHYIQSPLKITKTNHAEIIGKVLGDICRYYSDMEVTVEGSRRIMDEIGAAKRVLYLLGVGYFGANNSPVDPLNLSWMGDICLYKTAYRYLEKSEVKIPDFDFVNNYKAE